MLLIDQARELGIALASSSEFIRMKQAQAAIQQDKAVSALLAELQQKKAELMESLSGESSDGTFALSLSKDVERLQGQLTENPMFMELMESEGAFSALVSTVDEEINACIGNSRSGCEGNCGECGGCKH